MIVQGERECDSFTCVKSNAPDSVRILNGKQSILGNDCFIG